MQDAIFNRALVRKALDARPMQPQHGSEEKRSTRPQGNSLSTDRPRGLARGRAESPADPRESSTAAGAGARQGSAQDASATTEPNAEHESKAEDRLGADERERLEKLLSKVPDDPGSLLANRFAQQLRTRGSLHHDVGARW
jgi:hypothetical protein